jgi:type I restriction enzyme M protein
VPGFCKSVTLEISTHVLTPGRYVCSEALEDDDEPFTRYGLVLAREEA